MAPNSSIGKIEWRFGAALGGLLVCEAIGLLIGFGQLRASIWASTPSFVLRLLATGFGGLEIERSLGRRTGRAWREEFAVFYLIPFFAAEAGRDGTWKLFLSAAIFMALLARITWIWIRTKPQYNGQTHTQLGRG